MAAVHLRNVPEGVVAALKERAATNRRSMEEAEARPILEEALRPKCSKRRMLEVLAGGPLDDPPFDPDRLRSKETGRDVGL